MGREIEKQDSIQKSIEKKWVIVGIAMGGALV